MFTKRSLGKYSGLQAPRAVRIPVAGVGEVHRVQSKDVAAVQIIHEWLTTMIGARGGLICRDNKDFRRPNSATP